MKCFMKWVCKEYVYVMGFIISITLTILGILVFSIMLLLMGLLMSVGIYRRAYREWKIITIRYEKIHNKRRKA